MGSPFMVVLIVVGAVMIICGFIMNRRNNAKKSRQDRMEEFFLDYDERMSKLKKR